MPWSNAVFEVRCFKAHAMDGSGQFASNTCLNYENILLCSCMCICINYDLMDSPLFRVASGTVWY